MPETCNPWQTYGCEFGIGYLWDWTNLYERIAIYAIAFMLAYVVVVTIRIAFRYRFACRTKMYDAADKKSQRAQRKLICELNLQLRAVETIASTAPYLGLIGTCAGVLSLFRGYVGPKYRHLLLIYVELPAALLAAAAGIIVAITAICFHNYFRTRVDSLENEFPSKIQRIGLNNFQTAQRFPLRQKFSGLPSFAQIAAPGAIILTAMFLLHQFDDMAIGLSVQLASGDCKFDGDDRPIVLHITDGGAFSEPKLFLDKNDVPWNILPSRLSAIYDTRVKRMLYLRADDDVYFRIVADTIDIAASKNITVRLITPVTLNARPELSESTPNSHTPK